MDDLFPEEIGLISDSVNRFMETEVVPRMDAIDAKIQIVNVETASAASAASSFSNRPTHQVSTQV